MYTYTYTPTCVYVYIYIYTNTYTYEHIYICIFTYVHIYIHVDFHISICIYMYIYIYLYLLMYVYEFIYTCTYTFTYIQIHIKRAAQRALPSATWQKFPICMSTLDNVFFLISRCCMKRLSVHTCMKKQIVVWRQMFLDAASRFSFLFKCLQHHTSVFYIALFCKWVLYAPHFTCHMTEGTLPPPSSLSGFSVSIFETWVDLVRKNVRPERAGLFWQKRHSKNSMFCQKKP